MAEVGSKSDDTEIPDMTADAFVQKLRRALRRDGDFPASAKVVQELRDLVADPDTTANQITEVILREPSLGTRVLHLVNSSFYRRSKPIMTVSHAVVQIGMRPLAELCSSLVLLKRFIPKAREGGAFAQCLQQTITTSLLTSSITGNAAVNRTSKKDETGYLAGTFYELGILLTAYYFPKVLDAATRRSLAKKQDLSKSLHEITGLSAVQLSVEVIDALHLPELYKTIIQAAEEGDELSQSVLPGAGKISSPGELTKALFAAKTVSHVLVTESERESLDVAIQHIQAKVNLGAELLQTAIGELQGKFRDHCDSLDLILPPLPEFLASYCHPEDLEIISCESTVETNGGADTNSEELLSGYQRYIKEVKESVERGEATALIITSVMETLAFGLGFDRVLLLLLDHRKQALQGRMALGETGDLDPQSVIRKIGEQAGPYAPDATAFRESRPVYLGDPILEDGWPMAVMPIGFGSRVIGVVYCDRLEQENSTELTKAEQAAIGVLAELLDRSLSRKG